MTDSEKSVCDEKNYQALYGSLGRPLRNFLYYKCGDLAVAEDLAQESFIKLWKNCKDVVFDKAKSYLYTVGNRLFLNIVQHKKVVLKFEKSDTYSTINKEDPEFLMEENEFKEQLEIAISDLSEGQREVFLMNRIDKMTFKEIAATLDISVKAVEKRMNVALTKLKENLSALKSHKI